MDQDSLWLIKHRIYDTAVIDEVKAAEIGLDRPEHLIEEKGNTYWATIGCVMEILNK